MLNDYYSMAYNQMQKIEILQILHEHMNIVMLLSCYDILL